MTSFIFLKLNIVGFDFLVFLSISLFYFEANKFENLNKEDICLYECVVVEQIRNTFLVSKETVVLRRWERSKQKFGFIKRVDKGEITTVKDLES